MCGWWPFHTVTWSVQSSLTWRGSASLGAWNNSFRQSGVWDLHNNCRLYWTVSGYTSMGKEAFCILFRDLIANWWFNNQHFVSSWTPALDSLFTFLLYRLEVLLNLFTCAKWLLLLVLISKENQHPAARQLYWWGPIDFSLLYTYHQ